MLSIGGRRLRTVGIGAVSFLLGLILDATLPQDTTIVPVEAHKGASILLLKRLRQEDAIAPYDWSGVTTLRQVDFPGDVLFGVPLERQVSFRGHSGSFCAAPHGPVFGMQDCGEN